MWVRMGDGDVVSRAGEIEGNEMEYLRQGPKQAWKTIHSFIHLLHFDLF